MTDLTDKWKKGELPFGAYYVNRLNENRIWLYRERSQTPDNCIEIYGILAPVPSYNEWKDLREYVDYCIHNRDELTKQIIFWMDKYTELKELLKECKRELRIAEIDYGWDEQELFEKIDEVLR